MAKRLIVTIEEGLISGVYADGWDASDITLITVDYDTEGAEGEGVTDVGGTEAFFSPGDVQQASDEMSRDMRRAYDNWALTE